MNKQSPKMPKHAKKRGSPCDRHQFELKPRKQVTSQPQHYQVSFCMQSPVPNNKPLTSATACLNCPAFNRDGNFATPAFILGCEQSFDALEGQRLKEEHERRMVNYTDQKSSLNVPKPRSKNNYCSVCRHSYTDYLDHIAGQMHKKRIHSTDFNRHLLELTKMFKNPIPVTPRGRAAARTRRAQVQQEVEEVNEVDEEGDDSVEIISNPHKRIKPNENVYLQPGNNHHNWSTRLPFSNTYLEEAAMVNTHRPMHSLSPMAPMSPLPPVQSLNNYNFNISMNLCLNQGPSIGNFLPNYNPFLEMHYQSLLMTQMTQMSQMNQMNQMSQMGQMNHQLPFCLPPPEPIQSRPLTYIVIDE